MSGDIVVNRPMVDWVTLTTHSKEVGEIWRQFLFSDSDLVKVIDVKNKKRMQYEGFTIPTDMGSIFWGFGLVGKPKKNHWIVQISGALADEVFFGKLRHFQGGEKSGRVNCTRIDLQVTVFDVDIQTHEGYVLPELFEILKDVKESGRQPSWRQDSSKESALATVGINDRKSPTYYRVYAKQLAGGQGVRFEVEVKQQKAGDVYAAIVADGGRSRVTRILKYELKRLKIDRLDWIFSPALPLTGLRAERRIPEGESNQVGWLITMVLPTFERVVNTHAQGDMVARAFMDAVRRGMGDWE